jgi:PAS domain S-box-containing protein
VDALLVLLICGSVAIGWRLVQRPDSAPATCWVFGWIAAGAGSILVLVRDSFPLALYLAFPLGSLFPVLLLAGALRLAARPVPRWLLPLGFAYGCARAAVAATGLVWVAWAAALCIEPLLVLAAAWVTYQATPRADIAWSERLLAPSLVVLAALGAVHVAWLMRVEGVPQGLLAMWVVAVPSLLGVQLHSQWERGRRSLRRAHDELERRVEERTAELRESEARYRVATELGSDLAFGLHIDSDTHFYGGWFSDAFPRITGYSVDELQAGGWYSVLHPEDLPAARAQFLAILAGRAREMETRLDTKDGRIITVVTRMRVTRDGRHLHVAGAARDVTEVRRAEAERRRLEQRMFEAQRLESLAMLTGGVAHDFNNLLAVILGNSRAALAETPPEAPLYARLSRIRAAAEHGARLTEQMLAYSGKSSLALKPIDLSRLVEEMADLLRASVSERCAIELELAPRAPVEGDGTQLQQVMLNLVTNASEALGERDGRVRIRTGRAELGADALAEAEGAAAGRCNFLEISDDGPGMDEATRQRIFEPFFTTKFSGRGLGLAAVLGIVRAHRGAVQVESEPGRGTTVRVLLPEAPRSAARVDGAASRRAEPARRGTVQVVDDHESVVEVAQLILESAGHRVIASIGGRAGIEHFRAQAREIDAVLLDLTMPDADGEQVLDEIRRLRPDVRVIIATGYGAGYAAERVRSRVAGFVRKPYEPEEMLAAIDHALQE